MEQKRKRKIRPKLKRLALAAVLFFVLSLFPQLSLADEGVTPSKSDGAWTRSAVTAGNEQLIGLTYSLRTLLWTAGVVLESSELALTRVADITFYQESSIGGFYKNPDIGAKSGVSSERGGWNIVKELCNSILIIILLFIAFGTILRVESYNYKYLLVKLIVAALLINFSGLFAGIILDFSHIVMGSSIFSEKMTDIGRILQENSKVIESFQQNADLSDLRGVSEELAKNNITRTISRVNVNLILASVLMFILGISILSVALFLIIRTVSLWFLFTLSPLAFVLHILPHTRIASLKWWDAFLRNVFSGPLLFFFLYLTVSISKKLDIYSNSVLGSRNNESFILFSSPGNFLDYLFLVVLLWVSIFLSHSLSIAGSMQVVGYFRNASRGDRGFKVISKLMDSGGSALEGTRFGKAINKWTGPPLQLKSDLKGPFAGGMARDIAPGGRRGGAAGELTKEQRGFGAALKEQSAATKKALESLLNPSAVGRALSIVEARRQGSGLGQLGGNLDQIGKIASLSANDPSEFLRTLWKKFEPSQKPTGSFWKDARTLNEEINRQIDSQEKVRAVFNDMGVGRDKIQEFKAKDLEEKEAQIYKMAWTGGLGDYFNNKLGKAYNKEALADYLKSSFGDKRGAEVAEKLKMIGETKKDPSLNVTSWSENKGRFEVSAKPQETTKIEAKDLKKLTPDSITERNEKGQYVGFNEAGKQMLKQVNGEYMKEIENMREDTKKAISEAFKNSQKEISKEFAIKVVDNAQMRGRFNVQELQAPGAQISLGQQFLNKVAGRAFASKRIDTGGVAVADNSGVKSSSEKARKERNFGENMDKIKSEGQRRQEERISGRTFAGKKDDVDDLDLIKPNESKSQDVTGLKDKQKYLMLGVKKDV